MVLLIWWYNNKMVNIKNNGGNISMIIEDENGELIESSEINYANIDCLLPGKDVSTKYPWLQTIDPYGDTTFNGLQTKNVISELKKLAEENKNEEVLINETISFISKIDYGSHVYVKFIGD